MLRMMANLAVILWAALTLPCLADIWDPEVWYSNSENDEVGPRPTTDGYVGPFNWSQVDTHDPFGIFNFNTSSLETAWANPLASTTFTNTQSPGYNLTVAVTSVPGESMNTGFGILSHPDTWGTWPMAAASIKGLDFELSYACMTMLIYHNTSWQNHAQGDDGSCQTALSAECLGAVQDTTSVNTTRFNCKERAYSFQKSCHMSYYETYSVQLGPQNRSILNSDVLWYYTAYNTSASDLSNITWPVIMTWGTDNGSGTLEFSTSLTCARANSQSATSSTPSSSNSSSSGFAKPTSSFHKSWLLVWSVLIGVAGAVV